MRSTEFDTYIIYHEHQPDSNVMAVITCFLENITVGYIEFVKGNVPDPEILPNGTMRLFFPYERYSNIINTIRYEKPLFISIYGKKCVVSTVKEPVGEQEGTLERN